VLRQFRTLEPLLPQQLPEIFAEPTATWNEHVSCLIPLAVIFKFRYDSHIISNNHQLIPNSVIKFQQFHFAEFHRVALRLQRDCSSLQQFSILGDEFAGMLVAVVKLRLIVFEDGFSLDDAASRIRYRRALLLSHIHRVSQHSDNRGFLCI
jgi:hypothetical protein